MDNLLRMQEKAAFSIFSNFVKATKRLFEIYINWKLVAFSLQCRTIIANMKLVGKTFLVLVFVSVTIYVGETYVWNTVSKAILK